jgi:tetratricopeptide (TPR) repeat protein
LELSPDNPGVLIAAAMSARQRGDVAAARDYYEQALRTAPRHPAALLGLGDAHADLGEAERAIEAWRKALKAPGSDHDAVHLRLAAMYIQQGKLDDAREFLAVLQKSVAVAIADPDFDTSYKLLVTTELLQAQWHLAKGQPRLAIPLLKQVLHDAPRADDTLQPSPTELQGWLMMGRAHSELGEWDLAAAAFEQAARLPSAPAATNRAAAHAWAAAGSVEQAITQSQLATQREPTSLDAWLLAAQLQLQVLHPLTAEQRDWRKFDEALSRAKSLNHEAWQIAILGTVATLLRQQPLDSSLEQLRAAEVQFADSPELWQNLVRIYEQMGKSADADRALLNWQRLDQGSVSHCIVQAKLLADRRQWSQARQLLREAQSRASGADLRALRLAQVAFERSQGDLSQAVVVLKQLTRSDPADVEALYQLTEVAIQKGDVADAERYETLLQKLEGPTGCGWQLLRAQRLLVQTNTRDDPRLREARQIAATLDVQRPNWRAVKVLQGMLAENEGRWEEAVEFYQAAIRLGCSQAMVHARLARLLSGLDRDDEAQQYARSMPEAIRSTLGDPQPATPRSPAPRMTDQDFPFLVTWLLSRHRLDEAVRACLDMEASNAVLATTMLARVLLVGDAAPPDAESCEAMLRRNLTEFPREAAMLFAVANLRFRQQRTEEAAQLYRAVTEVQPENFAAWNNLAAILAEQPAAGESALQCVNRAIDLAGGNLAPLLDTKAVVLLHQGKASQAIDVLQEALKSSGAATPEVYFHLAMAYDQTGAKEHCRTNLAKARQLGLSEQQLTRSEQEHLRRLEKRDASLREM